MCIFCKQFTTLDVLIRNNTAFQGRRTRQGVSSPATLHREKEMWVIIQRSTAQRNVVTGKVPLSHSSEGRAG
jgi:hypothetical protein